jgi:hypothetical protein
VLRPYSPANPQPPAARPKGIQHRPKGHLTDNLKEAPLNAMHPIDGPATATAHPADRLQGPSYVIGSHDSAWHTYLAQVDRVMPYLGELSRWGETLKRPKRALVVDVPIELDNGTTSAAVRARAAYATTPM